METVASNTYYEFQVDTNKNRIYLTIKGFWKSVDIVPDYEKDGLKATKKMKKGFTVLTDLTEMKTPPGHVVDIHISLQKKMVENGLAKTAEIIPSSVLKLSVNRMSEESGMLKRIFDDRKEAEEWLDR